LIWLPLSPYASGKACTSDEAKRAESETDNLRSWKNLYRWYQQYRQCDDGGIAEGYSEAVARTLVDHWDTLADLEQISKRDVRFRGFVLRHVDETLTDKDLKTISTHAGQRCPDGLTDLCRDLKKKAEAP
jgi:hypothetical protein